MTSPTLLDLTGSSELPSSFPVVLACCLAAALGVPEENSASDGGPTSDLERGAAKEPRPFLLARSNVATRLIISIFLASIPILLSRAGHGHAHAVLRKMINLLLREFNECCKAVVVGDLPARVRDGVIASGVKVGVVFCYLAQQFIPLTKVLEAIGVQGPEPLSTMAARACSTSVRTVGSSKRLSRGPKKVGSFRSGYAALGCLGTARSPGLLDAEPGKEELLRSIPPLRRMDEAEGFDAIAEEPSPLCRVPCCCRNAAGHVNFC
ncbi:hypothetical protein KC359_g102 [Hortaea werneckii]|nr:hypothetical protein KC359_g102 [Hortaea werneckii]